MPATASAYLTLILLCQLAGELAAAATGLPVPGPVLGMVILFLGLLVRRRVPQGLGAVADALLGHLSLLFVPAGVGVMLHLELLARDGPAIVAALIASTLATVAATALVMRRLSGRRGGDG